MSENNIANYIVKRLEDYGVKYIFGYPGEQVIPLYEALRKSKIKHILMRHEQAAVHAADAYARITGNYGVCLATAGPGAMNLIMGVSTAYKDNVPLIVITGDVPTTVKGQDTFQDIDLNEVFKPVTIRSYNANTPERVQNNLEEILSLKRQGVTGPFHISIPKDIQTRLVNPDHKVIKKPKIKEIPPSYIQEVVKLIENAQRPVILAGAGIIYSHAEEDLKEFITKSKIPLTTSFSGRGVISEKDSKNLGMTGTRGNPIANYAINNADLIIALGTRLSSRTVKYFSTDEIIQVNTKEEHRNAKYFYQYGVHEFLRKINQVNINPTKKEWINDIRKQKFNTDRIIEETEKIHPELVVNTILEKMDENKTLVYDAGSTPTYFTENSVILKPYQRLFSGGFGPMGYSLPAAIGASFACDDDVILVGVGDGSIQMTIEELAVIDRYQLPVVIVIIDNSLLGIIKQWQDMANFPNYEVKLDNPDFIKIAQAYNIEARKVNSIEELSNTLDTAIANKKPYVIHIEVEDIPIPIND